jgi:type I restriction enzyme, R subunit
LTKPHANSPEGKARELIDKRLQESGWTIIKEGNAIPKNGNFAVEEVETDGGPMDYGLVIDGIMIGDVEAKPEGTGVPGIITQDERYSRNYSAGELDFDGYHIPFLYSSNGHIIWYKDVRSKNNLQREVAKFHTPAALQEYFSRDVEVAHKWLKDNLIDVPGIRPYQKEAIESIEAAIFANKTKLILAMATGTGKTFTAAELIYRLLKSKTAKRILFLVDRRALAAQAVREFAAFEPEPAQKLDKLYEVYSQKFRKEDLADSGFDPHVLPNEYLTNPKSNHTFVYVCTIQRMRINLFGRQGMFPWTEEDEYEDDVDQLNIPIHAFDFVIADECHRGYTAGEESKWREVLNHFDAVKIGLTATPAKHTTAYFREVVYLYPIAKAVQEGYLVDWDLVRIDSDIRMRGLFLEEGEEVQYIDPSTGEKRYDTLEDQREYDTTALERKATSPDSNGLILKEYAKFAREFERENGHFPKTLIFAVNDMPHTSHCDIIVEMLTDEFSKKGSGFVQKITGTVDRPLQKIRQFRNRPVEPGIVVTVDMLSTGVDIPTIEAIVFIRAVKSRILYEQMMGRGTRLAKDIGKTHFTVYDAVGVVDYFKHATNFNEPLPTKPTKTYKQVIDEIKDNKNRDYNIKILTRRLQRVSKNISAEGRQQLEPFIEDGEIGRFAAALTENLDTNWKNTMEILRNESFQLLLEHYPRVKNDFVVAPHQEDKVSSIYYPIVVHGKEYKPEDYLKLFREFLRNEPDSIAALEILLKRPKDLNTDLLDELKKKLTERPEEFTEQHLRRAYGNNLVDIIGMIRSALSDEPLLTTRERVQKAIKAISIGRPFSDREQQWLDLIGNHLEYNLLIERRHFAYIPFSGRGGWKKANQDFNNELENILAKVNEVMTS